MINLLNLFRRAPDAVSARWLANHARQTVPRVTYQGPRWQWPVKKTINESALWNTRRLRRRA